MYTRSIRNARACHVQPLRTHARACELLPAKRRKHARVWASPTAPTFDIPGHFISIQSNTGTR